VGDRKGGRRIKVRQKDSTLRQDREGNSYITQQGKREIYTEVKTKRTKRERKGEDNG